jgi:hypothetical protein
MVKQAKETAAMAKNIERDLDAAEWGTTDFPGKSRAWLKGRGDAIVYGDDVWSVANPPYFVGTPEAFDWHSGVQAGLDELAAEEHSNDPE